MKKLKWLAAFLIVATLFGGILGCKQEVAFPSDEVAPADVTELTATASNGNAVLNWKNPADTDFAGVQISMSPAEGTLKNAVSLGKDVVSFDVSGLENGKDYTFTVKTFDTSLNYSEGKEVKATVKVTVADPSDKTAPADVTELTVQAVNGNAVLSWKNPADTDFAGVQVAMSPAEGTLKNAVVLGKEVTSLDVSGLENGKEYTFTVKAFDETLNYSKGAEAKATVADTADYTAPANVTSLTVTAADGNAVLAWKNPADTDFAGVQISMSPAEGTLKNPVVLGKEVTSLDVSGLTIGKEYTFTVKAFDESLNYSEGVTAKATVADTSDEVAPADVTELTATNKDASVLLTWTDATDEDIYGYEVTWNKKAPINRSAAMESNSMMVAPGAKGCYISNLTNGTEYAFTVKSVDTSGNKSAGVTKTITPSIIEKSILQIALEPNTTERTNKDVVITVNATTDSASDIKKITYVEGTESKIDTVLAGKNITEAKEITATENTTFTVAVTDTAGRRELAFVTVNNIDKTAPAQVTNVIPIYSRNNNAIKLSWTNPSDEDFAGTEIVYGKTDSEETTTLTFDKNTTSATIKNIADDDSEYTIAIKTKDDLGNLSEAKTVTVVAATGAKITSVNLDRTHLDSIMANRNISVTITGSNFDLLSSLLVQVTDGSKAETPVTATINKETNTATATVIAPVPASPTNNGTTYTVKVIVGSTTPAETTAEFVVSLPADVSKITLAQTQIPVGTQETVTATITGYNFDIRGVTKVKLLDSTSAEVEVIEVPLAAKTSATEFTVDIPLPTVEGVYTVAVFFDDEKDTTTTTLQVYGTPIISEVTIPVAGINYAGNVLPVTIIGKNFTAPGVTASGFTISDSRFENVTIVSDTKATAEVTCPYAVETTNVTVSYGDSSATTTLKVLAAEKCFVVGDVLLTDGTRIKPENAQYGLPSGKNAFAVIASAPYGGGVGKAIGLQKSASSLMWAPEDTTGYNTNFTEIQASYSGSSSSGYTFEGDIDGSDNWEYICSIDPEGTQDAATNYPIFNFANTYGTTAGLTDTDYENGWYVPSLAELYEVYKNKEVIQTSLTKASGFTIGTSYYFSSSQSASSYYCASLVKFGDGSVSYYGSKDYDYNVFVLQAFNAEQFNYYEYNTEISSVEIPTIAEGFVGEVPVTITGKELIQKITVSGLTISRIDYISDAEAIAYATTTGTETETTITVSCGTASAKTTLKVIEYVASSYAVGDIILTNGTKVSVANVETYTIDENNKPIGVVAMISDIYGVPTPKVIGLQKSASSLMWAPDGTTGYNTKFTNIVCKPSKTGEGAALTATFTGDTEGSDNWEYICSIDPEGTQDAATNYPAFNFANTYGTTAGLTGTDYENGWYVPSLAELCEVYKNKEVIQISLTKANGFKFGTSICWSSSQNASFYSNACRVSFDGGFVSNLYKYSNYNVFVLQALTAE